MLEIRIPIHISGFWAPRYSSNPLESGSIGAGLNIAVYLRAVVITVRNRFGIILGDKEVLNNHVEFLSRRLGSRTMIYAQSPFDLGAGFGLSAGLTIAYSLATCPNFGFIEDCLDLAHEAEVTFQTGLGDVVAESHGGFLIRIEPGSPSRARVRKVLIKEKVPLIVCQTIGVAIDTPTLLKTIDQRNYRLAEEFLHKLMENPCLERFFQYSQTFTRRLFNYSFVDEALKPFRSFILGYYLKKRALVIWVDEARVEEVLVNLNNRGFKCIESTISNHGVLIDNTAKPSA